MARAHPAAMNSALWIAMGAALVVVLAHVGLFWWFLCKGNKKDGHDR
jgi:hypothetical protein